MKNFFQRSITGLVYGGVVLGALFLIPLSHGISMLSLMALFCIGSWVEFSRLSAAAGTDIPFWPGLFVLMIAGLSAYLEASGAWAFWNPILILLPSLSFILIFEVFRKRNQPILNLGVAFFGLVYLGLPLLCISFLAFPSGAAPASYNILLGLFLLIWTNDSLAYVFGVTLGRHRLLERISPKKSWEGAIGGGVSTIVLGYFLGPWLGLLSPLEWLGLAVVVVVAGTLGDLVESLLKRSVEIKDSGSFLPGHGGFLDRLDSLFLAAPLVLFYLSLIL
jgi:phosphatidate cytidylyltransferase